MRTPDDAIRVGLIGYGLGGSVFHAPCIAVTPGMRVAAIVTRDAERARHAAAHHPGARVVPDADALWAMARDLDLVVVAAPNGAHAPLAHAALAAGLPVVVDKPFATTSSEARAVRDDARARGLLVTVYQNRRRDGDFRTLRRLVAEGALGTLHRFESRFDRWKPAPKARWTTDDAAARGEGIALDLGTHLVDQALVLGGPAVSVYAELRRITPGVAVPDELFVSLEHASGLRSHLNASLAAALPGHRFAAFGSRGAYVKHGADPQEDALRAGARPTGPGWGEEPEDRWGTLSQGDAPRAVRTEAGDYPSFYAEVAAALRSGGAPPVDPDDAIRGLEVLEAAAVSSAERRVVALS
ncbi:Gfo/Idh/MocA family oxidoreductase [Roseisolibacter sp. H3M3-2]|uniref:Gfo/Idh/MocA family oxidoreductase n=1 Tax=Roseisolibacter sp. H3M3-2 TaxID=3031323 RepID=UPI0023DAD7DB|nr:Gfo/Idh/MocA family oxidoreductase [Roseisolibacter sp. H3M3-2]MDF1504121.1 Gfo/Idh/MocA family oxidoreductase [Roseisolibacter sp. H3M3-2]